MKIAFLLTDITRNGGVQTTVKNIINNLPNEFEITILSLVKKNKNRNVLECFEREVTIRYLFEEEFNFGKNLIMVTKKLRDELKNTVYDVIVANGIFYSIPLTFTKRNIRKIIWSHSSLKNAKILGLDWIGKYLTYLFMNELVIVTKTDFKNHKRNLFSRFITIHQIYNLINFEHINTYNSENKNILCIGTLSYVKGYDRILEIAPKILEEYSEWKWIICGDGEYLSHCREKSKELNIENRLLFIGNTDDTENYYKQSSLFVLPSRSEGFGLVTLEAKYHGLPIVAFECNGVTNEIITNEINGLVVKDNDVDELYKQILNLINNKDLRASLSLNSKEGNEEFNKSIIVKKWITLLKEK